MMTQCEQYLHFIRDWSLNHGGHNTTLGTPLPIGNDLTWSSIGQAAAKLRLPDGSHAVSEILPDAKASGLIKDFWTAGSYQPATRVIHVGAREVHDRSLSTLFHELAHAMLHHDIDDAQYRTNQVWIEAEADVCCDLVRCLLGAGPRHETLRTLHYMGNVGDVAAFYHFAGDALCVAACAIARALAPCIRFGSVLASPAGDTNGKIQPTYREKSYQPQP
jgi:hypothetical protein